MTRKHFIALATTLRQTRPYDPLPLAGQDIDMMQGAKLEQWHRDVLAIADCCQQFFPAFRRDTFLAAVKS